MVNQRAIGQGGGAVERLAGIAGVGHQGRLQQIISGLRGALTRQQLLAERGLDHDRFHPLAHAHHIRTEEFAGTSADILRAEVFHKHHALLVVGAQARAAVAVVIPQRPQLGRSTGTIAGRAGACRHIFQGHMAGQVAVVNHIGRLDSTRRHLDLGRGEGILRPVNRPLRKRRRGGHGKHLGLELVGRRGLPRRAGIREIRNPSDGDPARLGGEDLVRVRAVIIELRSGKGMIGGRGDGNIRLAAQGDVEAVHDVHPPSKQSGAADQAIRHRSYGDHPAFRRGGGHRDSALWEQRLAGTVQIGRVGAGKGFTGLHRLRAPVSRRGDRAAPGDLRTLDHIAEGEAGDAGGQAVTAGRAGQLRRHHWCGRDGNIHRARVAGGGGDGNRRAAERGAADSRVLRGGGAGAAGDGRPGEGDRRRGGVAAAAVVDRDGSDPPAGNHCGGGGRDARATGSAEGDHRCREVTRTSTPHSNAGHRATRYRRKSARPPRVEQVGGTALDFILRLNDRGKQEQAQSGDDRKSVVHASRGKVSGCIGQQC